MLVTERKPEKELVGLVYALTPKERESVHAWIARPSTLAWAVILLGVVLNYLFW